MIFKTKQRTEPAIEIAPLIDVVFLLLLFFMVTTHFSALPGLKVDLPAVTPGPPVAAGQRVEITISAGSDIFVDMNPVALEDLEEALASAAAEPEAVVVVLSADQNTPHGRVVSVMDVLRRLKLQRMVITARWSQREGG